MIRSVFVCVLPQALPLRVEAVLEEAMKIKFVVQRLPIMRHRLGLVHPDIERPLGPRAVVKYALTAIKSTYSSSHALCWRTYSV